MSCQKHRFQIIAWGDGSLDGDPALLKAHLDSCPACSEFHDQQLELGSLLSAAELELELPAGIWAAVRTHVEVGTRQEVPQRLVDRFREWIPRWHSPSVPALGWAGLAAVLLLSLSLFQLPSGPDPALMAQLDHYTVERLQPGNPFLVSVKRSNPFLSTDFNTNRDNPFAAIGSRP